MATADSSTFARWTSQSVDSVAMNAETSTETKNAFNLKEKIIEKNIHSNKPNCGRCTYGNNKRKEQKYESKPYFDLSKIRIIGLKLLKKKHQTLVNLEYIFDGQQSLFESLTLNFKSLIL